MATVSRTAEDPLAVAGWDDPDSSSKSERYLARRLAEAGAEVKGVALTTYGLVAGVAAMVWLLAGVLVEHWLVPGGLPAWARWAWLTVAVVAAVLAAIRWLLPIVRSRVNLVYAARAIEREHPELHNDVVNAVLARARADDTTPLVMRSLRRRAARGLSKVSDEGVMDRTLSLRLAAVLAGLIVAAVVYELAAPKSLLASTARLVAPWLGISAPSRVWIDHPALAWRQPGAPATDDAKQGVEVVQGVATLVRGRQLVVSARVEGLAAGEKPQAVVSPRREGMAGPAWHVTLVPAAAGRFSACLPDESRGLDQSIDLVIAAGDARSEPIRVAVVDTPTLLVREVTYHYPKYTGQPDETVEWQGDLRAVEGTDVSLVAESNHPVEAAWIDFGGDGKSDVPLKGGQRDLARVRGKFTLRLDADRAGPEHATYRLMFQPKASSLTPGRDPVVDRMEYRIDVVPDLSPEVVIVHPVEKQTRVPPGAPVTVRVKAVDPDFGLASVVIETRLRGGEAQAGRELFGGGGTTFLGDETIVPERLGAGQGAVLEYRAVAKDTRPGGPNTGESEWRTLVIDASAPPVTPPPPKPEDRGGKGDGEPKDGEGRPGSDGEAKGRDGAEGGGDAKPGRDDGKASDGNDAGTGGPDQREGQGRDQRRDSQPDQRSPEGQQERPGEKPQKSADEGRQDGQEPKSRQNDPKTKGDEGKPEQGEDQGAADGGQPQEGMKGKSGNQAGQRQQDGSSDGAGNQPQGKGGAGHEGEQQGERRDGRAGDGGQKPDPQAGDSKPKDGSRKNGGQKGATGAGGEEGGGKDAAAGGEAGRQDGERGASKGGADAKRESVAADGTDDGAAMERILEHRKKSGAAKGDEGRGGGEPQGDAQARAQSETKPGENKDGEPGDTSAGKSEGKSEGREEGKNPPREGQTQPPPACAGADGKPCGKEGCSSCNGGQGGSAGGAGQSGAGKPPGAQGQAGGEGATGGDAPGGSKAGQPAGEGTEGGGKGEAQQNGEAAGGADAGKGDAASSAAGGQQSGGAAAGREPAAGREAGERGGQQAGGREAGSGTAEPGDQTPAASPEKRGDGGRGQGGDEGEQGPGGEQGGQGQAAGERQAAGGAGGRVGGGDRQQGGAAAGERRDQPLEWSDQDLAHARNAADLAIAHLEDAINSGDRTMLDELGWTVDEAREFLARWERMREAAKGDDPAARGEFDQAVKSLGIRPGGVRSNRDVPVDVKGGQAEGRRSRPPSDYREQFRAFMQGAAAE